MSLLKTLQIETTNENFERHFTKHSVPVEPSKKDANGNYHRYRGMPFDRMSRRLELNASCIGVENGEEINRAITIDQMMHEPQFVNKRVQNTKYFSLNGRVEMDTAERLFNKLIIHETEPKPRGNVPKDKYYSDTKLSTIVDNEHWVQKILQEVPDMKPLRMIMSVVKQGKEPYYDQPRCADVKAVEKAAILARQPAVRTGTFYVERMTRDQTSPVRQNCPIKCGIDSRVVEIQSVPAFPKTTRLDPDTQTEVQIDGMEMTMREKAPWQVGFHVLFSLNEGGMVIRIRLPLHNTEQGFKMICVWVPFGSALLIRADLYISTCLNTPGTITMQGLLVPSDATGWDGTTPAYLNINEKHECCPCCKVDAMKVWDHAMKYHCAHYLIGRFTYWDYCVNCTTGTMALGLLANHMRQVVQWPNGEEKVMNSVNYDSDAKDEYGPQGHKWKDRGPYSYSYMTNRRATRQVNNDGNITELEDGMATGVHPGNVAFDGFQNIHVAN
jgi:hypothetical protein